MPDFAISRINERIAASSLIDIRLSSVFRIVSAVLWNRLEGRPRSDDLTRPLRAEVRDPAWMLARQWQFGEFEGQDAGAPIQAKLFAHTQLPDENPTGTDNPLPYNPDIPLEVVV